MKTFVEFSSSEIPLFYKDVGEHLRAWVPPPPKLKRKADDEFVQDQSTVEKDKTPPDAEKVTSGSAAIGVIEITGSDPPETT